jgi:hypothetical protein
MGGVQGLFCFPAFCFFLSFIFNRHCDVRRYEGTWDKGSRLLIRRYVPSEDCSLGDLMVRGEKSQVIDR